MNWLKTLNVLLLWACSFSLFAQIHFVKENAVGDGSSWANASGDLAAILAVSQGGDQIWVATGTYFPISCVTCLEDDRLKTFNIPSEVQVYGGFFGNETNLSQRNIKANPTILSGDIDKDGTLSNNAYSVVTTESVLEGTLVDGFIITMGNANKVGSPLGLPQNSGAAWFNNGALNSNRSNPIVRNCNFINNYSSGFGGAMYHDGAFTGQVIPKVINCTFENNFAGEGGGAIYHNASFSGLSKPIYRRCQFLNNRSGNSGGAIYTNAIQGTGLAEFEGCVFEGNSVSQYGGAVYNLGKQGICIPSFTNCLFTENRAVAAAGIYNLGSENGNASPIITNCTFTKNVADVGVAMYNQAVDFNGTSSPLVRNSIFWGNVSGYGQVFQNGHGTPTINHCLVDVADCSALNTGINGSINCGDGMLFNQDPKFADTLLGDFKLLSNSPAIDQGDNAVIPLAGMEIDLDSADRIFNHVVDLGAYEYFFDYDFPVITFTEDSLLKCEGEQVSWGINVSGTGPFYYQWYQDGELLSTENSNFINIDTLMTEDGGFYHCRINNDYGDTLFSALVWLDIRPLVIPTIQFADVDTLLCQGDTLQLNAIVSNEGTKPSYQWFRNGSPAGSDTSIFIVTGMMNDEVFSVQLTSSELCPSKNQIQTEDLQVHVFARDTASLQIDASALAVCPWDTVYFNATVVNGNGAEQYLGWQINGVEVAITDTLWQSTRFLNGDTIRSLLYPIGLCTSPDSVISNELVMTVAPLVEVAVILEVFTDSICIGDTASFGMQTFNPGDTPFLEWYVNGVPQGTNDTFFSSDQLNEGDTVWCSMVSSEPCPIDSIVFSEKIVIPIKDCVISSIHYLQNLNPLSIQPNPTNGLLSIKLPDWVKSDQVINIELVDIHGRIIHEERVKYSTELTIDYSLIQNGLYWLCITQNEQWQTARFTILK